MGDWELLEPGGECCLRGLQYLYGGPPPPPPPGDRLLFLMEKSKGASSGEELEVATE